MKNESWTMTKDRDAIIEDSAEWKMVAVVYGYNGSSEGDAPGLKERAALIAAAPELLEALNKIKTVLAVGRNVGEDKEQAYQDAEEIADAAIAKAEAQS